MSRFLSLAALAAASMLSVSVSHAGDLTPVGQWQTTTGESRYEVSYCGTDICAKLVWLRADARTPDNLAYLNTYVVKGARQVSENKWSGKVRYEGETIGGSMTMTDAQSLKLQGCKIVFCQTVEFQRI